MKIRFGIDLAAAMARGVNAHSKEAVIDVDPAQLTEDERAVLSKCNVDGDTLHYRKSSAYTGTLEALRECLDGDVAYLQEQKREQEERFAAAREHAKDVIADPSLFLDRKYPVREGFYSGHYGDYQEYFDGLPGVAEARKVADELRSAKAAAEAKAKAEKEAKIVEARELLKDVLADLEQKAASYKSDRDTLAEFLAAVPQDALRGTLKQIVRDNEDGDIEALQTKVEDASPVTIFEE